MSKLWALGHLNADTPFSSIFPDGSVPLKSILPIQPRDETAPACYVVDAEELTAGQVEALAAQIFQTWQPECTSVEQAIAYIHEGLPIRCDWFHGVATDMRAFL